MRLRTQHPCPYSISFLPKSMTSATFLVIMCHDGCASVPLFNHADSHDVEFTTQNWQLGSYLCSHTHMRTNAFSHGQNYGLTQSPSATMLVLRYPVSSVKLMEDMWELGQVHGGAYIHTLYTTTCLKGCLDSKKKCAHKC